jgi:outer membrane lipoprotein carrier protein
MRGLLVTILFLLGSAGAKEFLPKTFKAKFTQQYKSSLTGKTREGKGIIEYRYPGHIRFETEGKDSLIFVSNPMKTWYYTGPAIAGEPGQMRVENTNNRALSRFFDALKEGLKNNSIYTVEKMSDQSAVLVFSKKEATELGILKAALKFTKESTFSEIKAVEITYSDNKVVTMLFDSLELNGNLPIERFVFVPPKETRISP